MLRYKGNTYDNAKLVCYLEEHDVEIIDVAATMPAVRE